MSCPTCDHTMQALDAGDGPNRRCVYFWCPRCGTLKRCFDTGVPAIDGSEVPKLVERCREFAREHVGITPIMNFEKSWRHLGIAESINKPEGRPAP